jgi:hypothetical protein
LFIQKELPNALGFTRLRPTQVTDFKNDAQLRQLRRSGAIYPGARAIPSPKKLAGPASRAAEYRVRLAYARPKARPSTHWCVRASVKPEVHAARGSRSSVILPLVARPHLALDPD